MNPEISTPVKDAELTDQATYYSQSQLEGAINAAKDELLQKFESKINEREEKTTQLLAIFITLFTFISVNVTIFTRVQDVSTAAWFMILMALAACFILAFTLVCISSKNKQALFLLLICLVAGIAALLVGRGGFNPSLNSLPPPQPVIQR